jgi:hypothetical protein
MNIVVCGDSFCSADTGKPGSHFSELLQAAGNVVINLARGGMSNTGIAFQLQEAIRFNPDLIIFNVTSLRLTLPTGKQKFNKFLGLKNFCYPYSADLSSSMPCVGDANAAIWADVHNAILNPRPDLPAELHLSLEQLDAVRKYLVYLHDSELQFITEEWLIGFWKYKLQELNINFLQLSRDGIGNQMYQYVQQHPTLINQAVYHTDTLTQQLIAADILNTLTK